MFSSLAKLFQLKAAASVKLHATEICSECGSRLAQSNSPDVSETEWHCPNPDCPPQVLKRVIAWAEAIEIPGCDVSLVAQLVQRGLVRDAAEFYRLKLSELESLEGCDAVRARTVWDGIQSSRKREAWRVLAGLGIPRVGANEARLLCQHFATLPDMFAANQMQLEQRTGVSALEARSISDWYGDPVNRRLVRRLQKAGVNLQC